MMRPTTYPSGDESFPRNDDHGFGGVAGALFELISNFS